MKNLELEILPKSTAEPVSSQGQSNLVNLGIVESLGPDFSAHDLHGVLICGLPRSGTTAFAKAFEQLGFSLGLASTAPVAELAPLHPPLKAALRGGPTQRADLIDAIEKQLTVLASEANRFVIKLPDYYQLLKHQEPTPRGINLILFVTRDPMCIAVRNSKSVGMNSAAALRKAVREYADLIDAATTCATPSLLVSYEKLLTMPVDLLGALAQLLGLSICATKLENAAQTLVLNDQRYLKSSSLQRGELRGEIGYYAKDQIGGWCFWSGMPEKRVCLKVHTQAGEVIGKGITRRLRPELVNAGAHPTGQVGFRIDLSRSIPLEKLNFTADEIAVSILPSSRLRQRLRRVAGD